MAEAEDESAGTDTQDIASMLDAAAEDAAAETPLPPAGPGFVRRALGALVRYHSFIFLGISLGLAVTAWLVYPEQRDEEAPPADYYYHDGLDRLYRVLNPDLPLLADTPYDEALAARNAFLNLFVFYRNSLKDYPQFVNPHMLLAESNRILAEFNPPLAEKYYADATAAYTDALFWETREDAADNLAKYVYNNFLLDRPPLSEADTADVISFFEDNEDLIAARRARRMDYLRYRQAEADLYINHPELTRPALETIQRGEEDRRRENLRRTLSEEETDLSLPPLVFEIGPDDYIRLDYLLARANDALGRTEQARAGYLRYLAAAPQSRDQALVMERLADIAMEEGGVFRRANPETAANAYQSAADYYAQIAVSPSATPEQREKAILGGADANSRLAGLVPDTRRAGIDELAEVGRTAVGWLEAFSGQPMPRRTLALPRALGETLSSPELILPVPAALTGAVSGTVAAMAGGAVETPHERRRRFLQEALENYDRVAAAGAGTEAGDRAAVAAAWESWRLGRKDEAASRFERMLDDLSSAELIRAARLGLATAALDRGDLGRAGLLLLGGYMHTTPLWFTATDADWARLATRLGNPGNRAQPGPMLRVWEMLPEEGREIARYAASGRALDSVYISRFLRSLNTIIRRRDFYLPEYFPPGNRNDYLAHLLARNPETLTEEDVVWQNRMLLEEAWPYDLAQRGARDNLGFEPLPTARELPPDGLVDPEQVRDSLLRLADAFEQRALAAPNVDERLRLTLETVAARSTALDAYGADPGESHYALARNYEQLADIREGRGNHLEALSLTATAARNYLDVSLKARGSPREMDALLASGDAFFRAGLLERTVESQKRFLDRFGYSSTPGTEAALAVVRAENLLGRAYWFLGDTTQALESFNRNLARRTPDRYKSMYYIGRVLMEEGMARGEAALLGDPADPLPELDRDGNPVITTAFQAFNHLRQSPDINPSARAWRWATFDLGRLYYTFAENARRAWEEQQAAQPAGAPAESGAMPWLDLYDRARTVLTEALERYPLRRNGGTGMSVRVEPEDYADVMASRFETEYLLADTLLVLAEGRREPALAALARVHLANLKDRGRYVSALFDPSLDRFQLNSAVIREEVDGGTWDKSEPLPRTRLGDDEGPTHSPPQLRGILINGMQTLAAEYFQAGELAAAREDGAAEAAGYYRQAYDAYQEIYDRFGATYGSLAMVGMGDSLTRMGRLDDAANHYRMAENLANLQPADTRADGVLDMGPAFWGQRAADRLRDRSEGYVATP